MSGPANDAGKLTDQGGGGNRAIHTEPRNSMMIFAEPAPAGAEKDRLVPTAASGSIHYPQQGQVTNLNTISEEIVYFRPGTYYMTSKYHALLPKQVKWVYLAPGAYVKGAIRFPDDSQGLYKVTGQGVLSGEQYVYEADTDNNYDHLSGASNCHSSCVKMLQFASAQGRQQHLDLQGVTINEPPYHSFVVYGDEQTFSMRVDNYKQVGSWYWQTDGIELYRGSTMKNTFFNANDDVLKIYHSDVSIDNTVVWKNENGPVIQWGLDPAQHRQRPGEQHPRHPQPHVLEGRQVQHLHPQLVLALGGHGLDQQGRPGRVGEEHDLREHHRRGHDQLRDPCLRPVQHREHPRQEPQDRRVEPAGPVLPGQPPQAVLQQRRAEGDPRQRDA
jgi:hypothetical protein